MGEHGYARGTMSAKCRGAYTMIYAMEELANSLSRKATLCEVSMSDRGWDASCTRPWASADKSTL